MSGTFPSSPAPRDVAISSNQNTIVTTTASGFLHRSQLEIDFHSVKPADW